MCHCRWIHHAMIENCHISTLVILLGKNTWHRRSFQLSRGGMIFECRRCFGFEVVGNDNCSLNSWKICVSKLQVSLTVDDETNISQWQSLKNYRQIHFYSWNNYPINRNSIQNQLVHMSRKKTKKTNPKTVLSFLLKTESFRFGLLLKQNKTN